jgi:hypothetical protein
MERLASRSKGGGSLGRPRYVAIAEWRGGRVVREAKAIVPSAWDWAHGDTLMQTRFAQLSNGRFRSPDPFLSVDAGFVFRRIAADSRKVEFGDDAGAELNLKLLKAMGFELGSIHSADRARAEAVPTHLNASRPDWLYTCANVAAAAVEEDYLNWIG